MLPPARRQGTAPSAQDALSQRLHLAEVRPEEGEGAWSRLTLRLARVCGFGALASIVNAVGFVWGLPFVRGVRRFSADGAQTEQRAFVDFCISSGGLLSVPSADCLYLRSRHEAPP